MFAIKVNNSGCLSLQVYEYALNSTIDQSPAHCSIDFVQAMEKAFRLEMFNYWLIALHCALDAMRLKELNALKCFQWG